MTSGSRAFAGVSTDGRDLTAELVTAVHDLVRTDPPEEAMQLARHVVVDGIAVMVAGATEPTGVGRLTTSWAREQGGAPRATVIGGGFRTSPGLAAYVNGTLGHALDFDNTWYPMNHPTSPTLPAILALAETHGRSGLDAILALIAAFEVQARLRIASRGLHTGRGFHKNGITGTFGATIAAGLLLELDARSFAMAIGIAGSRAGSLAVNTGTMTKSSHSGHAARMGVEAAELAAMGFTANEDVFAPGGYFETFLGDEHDRTLLVDGFAAPLHMVASGVGFKKYPANYFTHRCIDAALAIASSEGFDASRISRVEIDFPDFRYVDRAHPESGLDAKFSVQYTTAVALLDAAVGIDSFTDERRTSADVRALLEKVEARFDPGIPGDFERMHATVTVVMEDGRTLTETVSRLTGMHGIPLTREQRVTKFLDCTQRVLEAGTAIELLDMLERFDRLERIDDVMAIVARTANVSSTAT